MKQLPFEEETAFPSDTDTPFVFRVEHNQRDVRDERVRFGSIGTQVTHDMEGQSSSLKKCFQTVNLSHSLLSSSQALRSIREFHAARIVRLDLSYNGLEIQALSRILSQCPLLEQLDMSHNRIAGGLLSSLLHSRLTSLNLSSNDIQGNVRLMYVRLPSLEELRMSNNAIADVWVDKSSCMGSLRLITLSDTCLKIEVPELTHKLSKMCKSLVKVCISSDDSNVSEPCCDKDELSRSHRVCDVGNDYNLIHTCLNYPESVGEWTIPLSNDSSEFNAVVQLVQVSLDCRDFTISEMLKILDRARIYQMLLRECNDSNTLLLFHPITEDDLESVVEQYINGECPLTLYLNIPNNMSGEVLLFACNVGTVYTQTTSGEVPYSQILSEYDSVFFPADACFTILDTSRVILSYICQLVGTR